MAVELWLVTHLLFGMNVEFREGVGQKVKIVASESEALEIAQDAEVGDIVGRQVVEREIELVESGEFAMI